MFQSALQWERVAMKWRNLAVQRRDHHFELYRSGRWKHYYTDEQFLDEMRKAVDLAERWEEIAPSPTSGRRGAKSGPAGKRNAPADELPAGAVGALFLFCPPLYSAVRDR